MKNQKFNIILALLTLLMGVFLFFEYQLDKNKYRYENISDFSQKHEKAIANYKKFLEYSLIDHLDNTQFSTLILKKDSEELDNYLYINYDKLFADEYRYINIYDSNGELFYSLNDSISKTDKNQALDLALKNKKQTQGYVFTKTMQTYRFVYPYIVNKEIKAYIDVGLDAVKLSKNLAFTDYDQVDYLIKKNYFDEIFSNLKYKNSRLNYAYYHVNPQIPVYEASDRKNIQLTIDRQLTKKEDFVYDILNDNIFLNQLIFLRIKDINGKDLGYLVNFSNDQTLLRIIILQSTKFVIILLMIWLLHSLYTKSEENSYFSKQLLDAMYKENIVSKTDKTALITFVNKNFCNISGYEANELIGKNHNIVRHEDMSQEFYKKMWDTINSKQIFNDVITNKRKDGSAYFVNSTIIPVLDTNDNIKEFLAISNDVGTLINAQKQLSEDIKFFNNPCCVNIKIDHYDMHSNVYPANLLAKLEKILFDELKNLKPEGLSFDKTYNLLNGEFSFLFDKKSMEIDEITILMKKFLQNLNNYKIVIDNYLYEFRFLIAFTTEPKYSVENQKIAIKNMSNNVFKEDLLCSNGLAKQSQESAKKNLEVMKMIEDALNSKNLVSYFQAIYNINEERIEKYESLVRIQRGEEVISPFFFMDIAKKSALYKKITIRVLENSFAILDKINEDVTINLSAADIEDLDIRNLLLGYFTTPNYYGRVTFEFLEDETVGDFELIKDFVGLARIMGGVKLAIDDFGSGYSNYERIVEIKPDILKIDGSLIKDISNNQSNKNIVKSIVQFAKSENIKTVAEFVSDEETYNCVKSLEIDYAQGYFVGKPCDLS